MRRPSVPHVLAAVGLSLLVAAPAVVVSGSLPSLAGSSAAAEPPSAEWSRGAETTAVAVHQAVLRQSSARAFRTAQAEVAEADRAAAEAAEAERQAQLAARAAEAARADRSRRAAADPRSVARELLAARGQGDQFSCLDQLWTKESEWRTTADNPTSSAYGIPQALPGRKMASAGSDWATNPETQIRWGLGYIAESYGGPCAAWRHSQARNWY